MSTKKPPAFRTEIQVVSWANWLVSTKTRDADDTAIQLMHKVVMYPSNPRTVTNMATLSFSWAVDHAERLAKLHPDEYITWCALQRVTGKRGAE